MDERMDDILSTWDETRTKLQHHLPKSRWKIARHCSRTKELLSISVARKKGILSTFPSYASSSLVKHFFLHLRPFFFFIHVVVVVVVEMILMLINLISLSLFLSPFHSNWILETFHLLQLTINNIPSSWIILQFAFPLLQFVGWSAPPRKSLSHSSLEKGISFSFAKTTTMSMCTLNIERTNERARG